MDCRRWTALCSRETPSRSPDWRRRGPSYRPTSARGNTPPQYAVSHSRRRSPSPHRGLFGEGRRGIDRRRGLSTSGFGDPPRGMEGQRPRWLWWSSPRGSSTWCRNSRRSHRRPAAMPVQSLSGPITVDERLVPSIRFRLRTVEESRQAHGALGKLCWLTNPINFPIYGATHPVPEERSP